MKLLVMLFGLFLFVSAQAATYTFAYHRDPPWFYKDELGTYKGVLVNVARGVFAQAPLKGMHLTFKELPLERIAANLKNGTLDMAPGIETAEKKRYGVFPLPALTFALCAFTKEGNPIFDPYLKGKKPLSLKHLRQMSLRAVTQRGDGWFKDNIFSAQSPMRIHYVKSDMAEVLSVLNDRADLLFHREKGVQSALRTLRARPSSSIGPQDRLVPLPLMFDGGHTPWPFMISKLSPLAKKLGKVNEAVTLYLLGKKKKDEGKPCTKPV